jgi:ADP-heptose:LPS heptosyltransferase
MSGIGDLLLITPALRALHKMYPAASFDIITYNLDHASFLFRQPYVNAGIVFPLFDLELKNLWRPNFWCRFLRTVQTVRKNRYDIYISFHHTWLPQWFFFELLLAASSGAKFRIGINPPYVPGPGVFDRAINETQLKDKHYREFFLEVVRLLGYSREDLALEFPILSEETEKATELVRSLLSNCKKLVSLHVGASQDSKRWPILCYSELGKRLAAEGCGIILIGSKKEIPLCAQAAKWIPESRLLNVSGKTDIFFSGALIGVSDLFIGNDSGPMHIAIARKKPTIGLIGPYHPRFHKYKKNEATIIQNSARNDAYDAIAVKESDYHWEISVDQVFNEALKMLSNLFGSSIGAADS